MLSLRTVVLLGAVVYLLPSDPARQEAFVTTANAAYQKVTTICERQPALCAKARAVLEDLKSKAHFGVGVIYALATGTGRDTQASGEQSGDGYEAAPTRYEDYGAGEPANGRGTLSPRDLAPSWRGDRAQRIRFE